MLKPKLTKRHWRLAKEGGWVVAGKIMAIAGSIFAVKILTEQLDPMKYGQLSLGLTVASLATLSVFSGIPGGIARFYPIAFEKKELRNYFIASKKLMFYAVIGTLIVGVLINTTLTFCDYRQWILLTIFALCFAVAQGGDSTLRGIQNAARKRSLVAVSEGITPWLKIICAVFMLIAWRNSADAVMLGFTLAVTIVMCTRYWWFSKHMQRHAHNVGSDGSFNWQQEIWSYAWPFFTWGLFYWMQRSSTRWSLEWFATTSDVGYYSVINQLGEAPIILATNLLTTFISPILFKYAGDATSSARMQNVHNITFKIATFCFCITLVGFLVTLLWHQYIFALLVAPEYQGVSYLLPWALAGGGGFATGQVLTLKMLSNIDSKAIIGVKVISALIGVGLNFFAVYYAGLLGAVMANFLFGIIYTSWVFRITLKQSAGQNGQ